ncbi:malate dehydrogenase [Lipomyces oligophaga]|uniref:malate dehydrogenase n=1 Tax=Lipomyces oligophaga TaxID=45792 RepID=UPI0034D007F8
MENHPFPQRPPLYAKGHIDCPYEGRDMLDLPEYNRGTGFTIAERDEFQLHGLLPSSVQTLRNQTDRAYSQFCKLSTSLEKNTFLMSLKVQNEVLYFRLLLDHIVEVFPVVYTPTESEAIENYSRLFRRPEGCFLDINHPEHVEQSLMALGNPEDIDYVIVSDGEEILGIGDQGVGAIGISSAKAVLMTLCAGVHPDRCLPVALDVGTDNPSLLNDMLYLGNRHSRVRGKRYDDFVEIFVQAVRKLFPRAILHFEDFGLPNARRLLEIYRPQLGCFNDDVQGTGAVTLAALIAAIRVTGLRMKDMRFVIFGAGTAGTGIADQIRDWIAKEIQTDGGSDEPSSAATGHIWLVDKPGLLLASMGEKLTPAQKGYARSDESEWVGVDTTSLFEIVRGVQPHVLIGTSTKPRAFTAQVLTEMARHVERPIVFPLSNPTRLHEATPVEIFSATEGRALVATGSPFNPVNGRTIAENNNCFIYPGLGLGAVLSRASAITDEMIEAAVEALAELSPTATQSKDDAPLLPDISDIRQISAHIASAVVLCAVGQGVARVEEMFPGTVVPRDRLSCLGWVEEQMWEPTYKPLHKIRKKNCVGVEL